MRVTLQPELAEILECQLRARRVDLPTKEQAPQGAEHFGIDEVRGVKRLARPIQSVRDPLVASDSEDEVDRR